MRIRNMNKWDELSLGEKSEIMRKAVDGGIYNLNDIRSAYNSYAEGGSLGDGEPVAGGEPLDYHIPSARTYAGGGHIFKDGGGAKEDRRQYVMDFFMRKGLSKEAAAGLVGNLMRESGLNPEALNKNGGAYGIAQWLGPRKKRLFDTYGSRPTLDQQLEFVWNELNSTHRKGLEMLKTSKTVDEAARNALGYYEFSAGPDAAIAALNKSGMNTKWKNPPGQKVMMQGIDNAWKAYGGVPDTPAYTTDQNPVPQFQLLPRENDATLFQPYPEPVELEERKDDTPAFMKKRDEEFDPFALLMSMNSEEEQPVQETAAVKTTPMFTMPMRTFGEGGGATEGSDTDDTYYAGTLPEVAIKYRGRPAEKINGKIVPKRIRRNDSKTRERSEYYENMMRDKIVDHQKVSDGSNPEYDIPFIPSKSILLGGSTTSTNALDSLVKYAAIHNANPQLSQRPNRARSEYPKPRPINMNEMLGLAYRETRNGAWPYFNMDGGNDDRAIGNSNYFKSFGYIPADNFVRDYHYNKSNVSRDIPPLLDAFQYYAQGDYNRREKGHTYNVNASGKEAWKNEKVLEWWNGTDSKSGKNLYNYWYNKTKKDLKTKK